MPSLLFSSCPIKSILNLAQVMASSESIAPATMQGELSSSSGVGYLDRLLASNHDALTLKHLQRADLQLMLSARGML